MVSDERKDLQLVALGHARQIALIVAHSASAINDPEQRAPGDARIYSSASAVSRGTTPRCAVDRKTSQVGSRWRKAFTQVLRVHNHERVSAGLDRSIGDRCSGRGTFAEIDQHGPQAAADGKRADPLIGFTD